MIAQIYNNAPLKLISGMRWSHFNQIHTTVQQQHVIQTNAMISSKPIVIISFTLLETLCKSFLIVNAQYIFVYVGLCFHIAGVYQSIYSKMYVQIQEIILSIVCQFIHTKTLVKYYFNILNCFNFRHFNGLPYFIGSSQKYLSLKSTICHTFPIVSITLYVS